MKDDKEDAVIRFQYAGQDELQLPATHEAFETLKKWLSDVLEQLHASSRDEKQFIVAADEIFSNIVNYAYVPDDEDKTINVMLSFDRKKFFLSMVFADRGIAFNPLEKEAKLPQDRIRNRLPGGIGLFLVHQFMDELTYRREGAYNVLTIAKMLHLTPTE